LPASGTFSNAYDLGSVAYAPINVKFYSSLLGTGGDLCWNLAPHRWGFCNCTYFSKYYYYSLVFANGGPRGSMSEAKRVLVLVKRGSKNRKRLINFTSSEEQCDTNKLKRNLRTFGQPVRVAVN